MRAWLCLMMAGCSVPQPEMPPEPIPEPRPHRSIDELPGPHPMPVPSSRPTDDAWTPVNPATVEPLSTDPCNPGMADIYASLTTRDATVAGQVGRAILGCLQNERLDPARALADALSRPDATPVDHYLIAKVLLAQRGDGGETVCENNAYLSSIQEHVEAAADPVVSARMMADDAFAPVRHSYEYGLATTPGSGKLAERMQGTHWFGPGRGAFGTLERLELTSDGGGTLHIGAFEETEMVWTETPITWTVASGALRVTSGDATTVYTLTETHTLRIEGSDDAVPAFLTYPSECSA